MPSIAQVNREWGSVGEGDGSKAFRDMLSNFPDEIEGIAGVGDESAIRDEADRIAREWTEPTSWFYQHYPELKGDDAALAAYREGYAETFTKAAMAWYRKGGKTEARAITEGMSVEDLGSDFSVTVDPSGVADFKDQWPGSELPDNEEIWFNFDKKNGDLVDMSDLGGYDGGDVSALADDAKAFGMKELGLREARSDVKGSVKPGGKYQIRGARADNWFVVQGVKGADYTLKTDQGKDERMPQHELERGIRDGDIVKLGESLGERERDDRVASGVTHRHDIVDAMAKYAYASAWADAYEEKGGSLSGMEIMDVAPPPTPEAKAWAEKTAKEIERMNKGSLDYLLSKAMEADGTPGQEDKWVGEFGYGIAMPSLGHGVHWFDNHEKFPLELPHTEFYVDPEDVVVEERSATRELSPEERIAKFREIVQHHQHAKVDGVGVDAFSASAVTQVYDALTAENKAKYAAFPAAKMVDVAWKLIGKTTGEASGMAIPPSADEAFFVMNVETDGLAERDTRRFRDIQKVGQRVRDTFGREGKIAALEPHHSGTGQTVVVKWDDGKETNEDPGDVTYLSERAAKGKKYDDPSYERGHEAGYEQFRDEAREFPDLLRDLAGNFNKAQKHIEGQPSTIRDNWAHYKERAHELPREARKSYEDGFVDGYAEAASDAGADPGQFGEGRLSERGAAKPKAFGGWEALAKITAHWGATVEIPLGAGPTDPYKVIFRNGKDAEPFIAAMQKIGIDAQERYTPTVGSSGKLVEVPRAEADAKAREIAALRRGQS